MKMTQELKERQWLIQSELRKELENEILKLTKVIMKFNEFRTRNEELEVYQNHK